MKYPRMRELTRGAKKRQVALLACASALLAVFVGTSLHFRTSGFALVNVAAGLLWIWIAVRIRRYQVAPVAVPPSVLGGTFAVSRGVP